MLNVAELIEHVKKQNIKKNSQDVIEIIQEH